MRLSLLAEHPPAEIETPAVRRRRRLVVCVVLVVGSTLLALALATDKGSGSFYALTLSLAVVWGGGALASGPLHLGSHKGKRPILAPVLIAAAAWVVFVIGAQLTRLIPALHRQVLDVLNFADDGTLWVILIVAVTNAIAEEAFFRGALYSAFENHRPEVWSTVVYVVVTTAGANICLVLAAVVMGALFALERRATRGVLAPMITHVVWSLLIVLALPR